MKNYSITPMDLQLFADGGGMTDEEIQAKLMEMFEAEEGQEEQTDPPVEGIETPEGEGTEVPPEPQEEQTLEGEEQLLEGQEPQGDNMLLGKFKSIEDLANAYQNLESYMTQTRQELARSKELVNQLQDMTHAQQNQLEIGQQPTGEEEPEDDSDFMDLFYSDPKKALRQVIEETINPQIEPLRNRFEMADKQEKWAADINSFAKEHPDLPEYQAAMADIIIQHPELRNHPNGLQFAYDMAKGRSGVQDPNQLLQNEEFVNQNILSNKAIKEQIIKQYLEELQGGAPPASIGTSPAGGQIPLTPPKRPETLEEADEMALKFFQK